MSDHYLQLNKILFIVPKKDSSLYFYPGVNVICGASDTGKSFLAESIDFMFGGTKLRDIPEIALYAEIELHLSTSIEKKWCLKRAITGGNFRLIDLDDSSLTESILKQDHNHGTTDNLSGSLLKEIGLLNKRILRSSKKLTTQSLSFRNLARLVVIQEDEIQQNRSPFWSGQHTTKTSDIAAVKLLLTDIDDSAIIPSVAPPNNNNQLAILDEFLLEISTEMDNIEDTQEQLELQLEKLKHTIEKQDNLLSNLQQELNKSVEQKYAMFESKNKHSSRLSEISELLARFQLLKEHYLVDINRLQSIQESGSIFFHLNTIPCPTCGVASDIPQIDNAEIQKIIISATAEIEKINQLLKELDDTVQSLYHEQANLTTLFKQDEAKFNELDQAIQQVIVPQIYNFRSSFCELIEKRSSINKTLDLFSRYDHIYKKKQTLLDQTIIQKEKLEVNTGIPESIAHQLSLKISDILKAWKFPGECHVYFDRKTVDFVIDGKPRGSSGKGIRAITHAAVSVALLEYCQANNLSHPGFLILDSPLLAYYAPESEEEIALSGSDLKEMFYAYLIEYHGCNSQIIIVENQHPPVSIQSKISMTVFTHNSSEGRFGFL